MWDISSAIPGAALNVLTLAGMTALMFYLDWRFSLIALSVTPIMFVVVYRLTRRIKSATRAVKQLDAESEALIFEGLTRLMEGRTSSRSRTGWPPSNVPT